jgi:hypothetical protein
MANTYEECRIVVGPVSSMTSPEAVYNELAAGVQQGWLQTTASVWRQSSGGDWSCVSGQPAAWTTLPPLDGEFVLDDETSASLRHLGENWSWAVVREVAIGGVLVRRLQHTQIAIEGGTLHYAVYWREVPEGDGEHIIQVWRPWVARFVGFGS